MLGSALVPLSRYQSVSDIHGKLTVDSGEALYDDGASSEVSRLQGSVLSAGSFTIVLVSNHHPVHSFGLNYTIIKKDEAKLLPFAGK